MKKDKPDDMKLKNSEVENAEMKGADIDGEKSANKKSTRPKKISCAFCKSKLSNFDFFPSKSGAKICPICAYKAYKYYTLLYRGLNALSDQIGSGECFFEEQPGSDEEIILSVGNLEATAQATPFEPSYMPNGIMKERLDEVIVGHENAKRHAIVAINNHYKSLISDLTIEKSNVLLVGPTGCGKTLLAKTIAELLDVPMVSVDITAFTTAGYVGKNVEEIIEKLLINANLDVKKCESGIVYIDEIDKIVAKGNPKMDSDVGGASLQHSLLKIIEGDKINITIRCQTGLHNFEVDTSKILFICGGSFAKVVESKIQSKKTIGFDKLQENIDDVEDVTGEDIVASGFSREIMGRLPVIVQMHELTLDEIVRIIKEPKNSILQQCKNIFAFDGIDLSISDEACRLIAEKCLEKKFGARGLKTIFESVMFKYMYEAQSLSEKYNRLDFTVKDGDVVGNWSKLKEKTVKK